MKGRSIQVGSVPPPPPPPPPTTSGSVNVSGSATFDLVPLNTATNGLNYDAITQSPIRGATVQAVDAAGVVVASSQTDTAGNYNLTVDDNTDIRVRVLAEITSNTNGSYDVSVVDNTNNDAVYAIQGALVNSGTSDSVRNLNADSGWNGTAYASTRAAGPFAVLDPIFETVTEFLAAAPRTDFPELDIGWSPQNRSESGDRDSGAIGTSSYVGNGQSGMIFILGDDDADTDEYDRHVITHEWGHYFEDRISRSDSVGGPHSLGDRLDARVAMGEGWGNALSGIILDDSIYRDSSGTQQSRGFSFDVEDNNNFNEGWFNEGSVQSIIFDIFDNNDDGSDTVSLGLGPIFEALTDPNYVNQSTFTTIFSFVEQVRIEAPGNDAALDALLAEQSINGTGFEGTGETNSGRIPTALPVYHSLTPNGTAIEVCSVDNAGDFNNLGNRSFVRFDIPVTGSYAFSAVRTSGPTGRDPDINAFRGSVFVARLDSPASDSETGNATLQAGEHVLEIFDFLNIDQNDNNNGDVCFDLSIQAN